MKTLLFLFTALCCIHCNAKNKFEKLCEVNKCWSEQKDLSAISFAENPNLSEREWIKLHLSLVEKILRARDISQLTPEQRRNRMDDLIHLHEYWLSEKFPINDVYNYRTPIFIDKYNNFCAVGYLLKASGHEEISRMIASKTNLAYVREMHYSELDNWAKENGFTVDELAWIQPGYPPTTATIPIGKGTDGEVDELFADEAAGRIYVGGNFSTVDSTITSHNIAYITEVNGVYTWHDMAGGLNGKVNAIVKYNNNIFVAGTITTLTVPPMATNRVVYWDGSIWHDAGCLTGEVKKLIVFNNELYAVGHFDICAALSEVNFAKWNGTNWEQIPGIEGTINAVEEYSIGIVFSPFLVLGGNFKYQNVQHNIIKWVPQSGFQTFSNDIKNEVKDLKAFSGFLYAACKRTSATDSALLQKWAGNTWDTVSSFLDNYFSGVTNPSYNTLVNYKNEMLMMGGHFTYYPMLGTNIDNCVNITPYHFASNWFGTDSAINKMIVYKNNIIAGGKFKYGSGMISQPILNGITRVDYQATSVKDVKQNSFTFSLYPNPVTGYQTTLNIQSDVAVASVVIRDMEGKIIMAKKLNGNISAIRLPSLSAGIYIAELQDNIGNKSVQKLIVE